MRWTATRWRGWCARSAGSWTPPRRSRRVKEFWWEREWRHVGDLSLPSHGTLFLCPEKDVEDIVPQGKNESKAAWNRRKRQFIDPRWGLERIIAHLALMPKDYVTPL